VLSVHLKRQCEMEVDDGADVLLRQLWQLRQVIRSDDVFSASVLWMRTAAGDNERAT
jgi:hypothetical protein